MQFLRNFMLAALALVAVASCQDVVPGLLAELESRSWTDRSGALERIIKLPDAMKNPVVRSALLSRLDAENQLIRQTLRESNGQRSVGSLYGEGYSEYYSALGDAVDESANWDDANTLRILAQGSFNPESRFGKRLASYADRILPTLVGEANGDIPLIRTTTLAYVTAILHVYKPESLKPEGAAQLLSLLNDRATVQERDLDVRIHAARLLWQLADVNGDRKVDCADVVIVRSALGTKAGGAGFDARADVNLDGVVDERDLAYVTGHIPAGMRCQSDQ
jgi:hypothetical protein